MTQLKYALSLQFNNAGGAAAHAALRSLTATATLLTSAFTSNNQAALQSGASLHTLARNAQQAAAANRANAQAAQQSSTSLRSLTNSSAQAAAAAAQSAGALNANTQAATRSSQGLRTLTGSALQSARANRANSQASTQSAASLRDLSSSASQTNAQLRLAAVEMAQLVATTRQATQAQLALTQAMQAGAQQIRQPHPNPMPWLPELLRNSRSLQVAWMGVKAGAMGFAAGAAVKSTVAGPFQEVMAYDLRLAHASNTAYSNRNVAGRQQGAKELDKAVMIAARAGGGTRDAALEAAEIMLARNAIGRAADVYKLLPSIMKSATAGNANASEIATIASVGVKTGGITVDEVPKMLGMALYAGQAGGFELKDMAKWLPQHITMSKKAGIKGQTGIAKMLALSEMAINSAGTKDEAGNNVRDFLHELNATNTANHLRHFSVNEKTGYLDYHHGTRIGRRGYIDLGHTLAKNQGKGIDAVDTIIDIVRQIAESDPKFREAKAAMAAAKARGDSKEQQAIQESVYHILMGRGVGKLFNNQQSLMGGIGAIMNPEEYRRLAADIEAKGDASTTETNFQAISETASYKMQQKANEEAAALHNGLAGATGALGKYADTVVDLYRKNPVLAASIEAMTVAAKAATAALGVLAGAALLSRGLGTGAMGGLGGLFAGLGAGALALASAKVALVGGAAAAAGHYIVAPGIDYLVSKTSKQNSTLGGLLFDTFNGNTADMQIAQPNAPTQKQLAEREAFTRRNWLAESGVATMPVEPSVKYPQLTAMAATAPQASSQAIDRLLQAQPSNQSLQITNQIHLDGHQIATSVNEFNGRQAVRR